VSKDKKTENQSYNIPYQAGVFSLHRGYFTPFPISNFPVCDRTRRLLFKSVAPLHIWTP